MENNVEISDLSKRFLDEIKRIGISGYKISKKIPEITESKLTHIRKGRNEPSRKVLDLISIEFSSFDLGYVLTGKKTNQIEIDVSYSQDIKDNLLPMIPFDAVAGYNGLDHDGVILSKCVQYSIPDFSEKGAEFVIRVSGNSMYPKYSNGDILACKKVHEILFFQWGKDYVIDSSQGTMIKRVYEEKENQEMIRLYSDNKEFYPEFVMPKSDIRSLSIVVGLIRTE